MAAAPNNGPFADRGHQAFPVLDEEQIARMRPFAERRAYADGELLFEAGAVGAGLFVVTKGEVAITRRDGLGNDIPVVNQGVGQFLAEVGQLSGKPAFVDGRAVGEVEALLLPPADLRRLLVADAELSELVMRALILRRVNLIETGAGGLMLVGPPDLPDMVRLVGFLTRNGHPHVVEDPKAGGAGADLFARHDPHPDDLPLVLCPDGSVLRNPTEAALARMLRLDALDTDRLYDVTVVGAGPAGLAAAVYAASEGLSVAVLDARAFGGQAGASARIENYLGFPTGISGQALSGRAFVQALKFGAEIAVPAQVVRLRCGTSRPSLELADGRRMRTRAVVVASGAAYRRPNVAGLSRFEGRGIYYWASPVEATLVAGREVALVGGGNSAGQAAVFLSRHAARIHLIVRRPLAATMSQYLIDRIAATPNIELHPGKEIAGLEGDRLGLAGVSWRDLATGETTACPTRFLFLFIGADPNTGWMGECEAARDRLGFVMTGDALSADDLRAAGWPLERRPSPLETSIPGVFAIGDARAGSIKRVAAAVGEGAAVVAQLHAFLAGDAP
ncbi:MAG: FAD-dependent oxidoreductase [Allosphingosinicella sp.]|uniref:FAD-dependent oxidoreductase n=1 Tax=Allosphingosinicella sp. TaxID=2823234 RepID=UPI0039590D7C